MKVDGLSKVMGNLRTLQRNAKALDGEHRLSFRELFPDRFMTCHSDFRSMQEMLDASGVSLEQFDTSASARATQRPPIGARQSAGFAVLSATDSDVKPFRGHTTSGMDCDTEEEIKAILRGQEWNNFVARQTTFAGWEEMKRQGSAEWARERLHRGLR